MTENEGKEKRCLADTNTGSLRSYFLPGFVARQRPLRVNPTNSAFLFSLSFVPSLGFYA